MPANVRIPAATLEHYVESAFRAGEPLSRDELIQHAVVSGAPALVIEVLENLNEIQQFYSVQQVVQPLRGQGFLTDYRR